MGVTSEVPSPLSISVRLYHIKTRLTELEKVFNEFESDPSADYEILDLEGRLTKHLPLLDEPEKICETRESLTNDGTLLKSFEEENASIEKRYYTINGRIKKIHQATFSSTSNYAV